MSVIFQLNDTDCVAQGMQRTVFLHPTDPHKLIKVLRDTPQTKGRSRFGNLAEKYLPHARTRHIREEYMEYLRLMLANQSPTFRPPITHMYGFEATQIGLGCITERVADTDGNISPTLHQMITDGTFDGTALEVFNDTVARIYRHDIRASDLIAKNFVFGHR